VLDEFHDDETLLTSHETLLTSHEIPSFSLCHVSKSDDI